MLLLLTTTIALTGCLKPDAEIHGALRISGVVREQASGTPLAGMIVTLSGTVQKKGPIGYLSGDELLASDTTDPSGAYSFDYESRRETGYEVHVLPTDLYLEQALTAGRSERVTGAGNHTRDIGCVRTGFAAVELHNATPGDTSLIALSGPVDRVHINRLYRDTVVYLRIYGDRSSVSNIQLMSGYDAVGTREVTAGPADTIRLRFDY